MTSLSLPDARHFIGNLSYRKIANATKILSSFYLSRATGSTKISALPFTVSIEPTTHCNLRCPECPSGRRSFSRDTGTIDRQFFMRMIDELESHLIYLYLYFQGEPYLHPQFSELVRYAAEKNIYTVTSTNAHYLDDEQARTTVESGLSRIIISMDGTTQQSYEQYRIGGRLDKVLDGAANLVKWKKKLKSRTPHIIFQMVLFNHNEHEITRLCELAKEVGADEVLLKTAQVYDPGNSSVRLPENEKYSRYSLTPYPSPKERGEGAGLLNLQHPTLKNTLLNHCWKLWHSSVITWDGKVVPCCFDKDASHVMGDLKKRTFREIWNSEPYLDFRQRLLRSRKEIDICSNCSEGAVVWV